MGVQIRRLPPEQWDMLSRIDDGWAPPDEKHGIAIVAQTDKREIVGRIFLVAPAHLERIFIRREFRDRTLMKRLVEEAEVQAKREGLKSLLAFAKDEEMTDYIRRLDYTQQPWTIWMKELL